MGLSWKLLNLDRRDCGDEVRGKLGEFFFDAGHEIQRHYGPKHAPLTVLPTPVYTPSSTALTNRPDQRSQPLILQLPPELLATIATVLYGGGRSFTDLYCFALTCRTAWNASQSLFSIYLGSAEIRRSWDNQRLMCVSDHADTLPRRVKLNFTEAELNTIKEAGGIYYYCWHAFDPPNRRRVQEDLLSPDEEGHIGTWARTGKHLKDRAWRCTRHADATQAAEWDRTCLTAVYESLLGARQRDKVPNPVLRNLSKKMYVRQKTVNQVLAAHHKENVRSRSILLKKIYLGDILLSQICLSYAPDVTMKWDVGQLRLWAGDRFDIVPEGDFPQSERAGWEDRGEQLAKLNIQIRDWCYSKYY